MAQKEEGEEQFNAKTQRSREAKEEIAGRTVVTGGRHEIHDSSAKELSRNNFPNERLEQKAAKAAKNQGINPWLPLRSSVQFGMLI